jgi:pSer/pThr/pTyr-binding forkhead associated (FHA) protein
MGKVSGTNEPFTAVALATVTLGGTASAPDHECGALVAVALADELREQARALGQQRDFAGAIVVLERAIAQLEATPGYVAGAAGPLNDAREALKDDVAVFAKNPTEEESETYRKAQRHEFDFAAGSKAYTNQVGFTRGTENMSWRANKGMPAARLIIVKADDPNTVGVRFPLGAEVTIGRGQELEVALDDAQVSRRHAKVVYDEGAFWLFDLGSSNTTAVNGAPVMRHRLTQGDVVSLGRTNLRFDIRVVPETQA